MTEKVYSARSVYEGLRAGFHQYLEAQYHIWDEHLIEERKALLNEIGVSNQEPRLEGTPFYRQGKPYPDLAIPDPAKSILVLAAGQKDSGIYERPYQHQTEALESFLGRREDIIVATGTGSGKTESFLMPILGSLAKECIERPESWQQPGMRALLLYPMNALVNDQLSRLRKLLGNQVVAEALRGKRGYRATFAMYTSRTPYPGKKEKTKDRDRLKQPYENVSTEARAILESEGKWPAKDMDRFLADNFTTGPNDAELLSRQEIQKRCPDLLVTNYSMLEYMLVRPIEREIFDQTAKWLADPSNYLTVVLDEAHMYRGSAGAEVAYLLRRLHSRLRVERARVRYILTSASLGESENHKVRGKRFAADLTGLLDDKKAFTLITGTTEKKPAERTGLLDEAATLSSFPFSKLHRTYEDLSGATEALRGLFASTGKPWAAGDVDAAELKLRAYDWLNSFGPASRAANLITNRPERLPDISSVVFPGSPNAELAMESLLALMSFARERGSNRVYCPVRVHLFFRGLPGLFACVNPRCPDRVSVEGPSVLGKLYDSPRLHCACGSRVYELLTHRDCGAAFIRGFVRDPYPSFLWHEPSSGLWSDGALLEAHFLVEPTRQAEGAEGYRIWLHRTTGQLISTPPSEQEADQYLLVARPHGLVRHSGQSVLSFDGKCPVCSRRWMNAPKIMDLATKGEAPFAHLVKQQVALQPATRPATPQSPNAGRKALLFSDGRQKAARLARDIPREIEQDVFRQVLFLAAQELQSAGIEPRLNQRIYVASLSVLDRLSLHMFDGVDRHRLQADVLRYGKRYRGDLMEALADFSTVPTSFSALLLRQLGAPFYSISALTLGYVAPLNRELTLLTDAIPELSAKQLRSLAIVGLQSLCSSFAFDERLGQGVRNNAAGYPCGSVTDEKSVFTKEQRALLASKTINVESLCKKLVDVLGQRSETGAVFVAPGQVKLHDGTRDPWFRCPSCTAVQPVTWWELCPTCFSERITPERSEENTYLRARKAFWRDPVVRALEGTERPMNITVEEHTAQLSYLDRDERAPTTERYEWRFRDVLIGETDTSIDVLSSTTTMEVGIDIGSLVAVGLRNVPPMRQNYQQRAGRAGRRGSAISTVLTYAQNSPHDAFYFSNPAKIISGDPPSPGVHTDNERIIVRHIHAQLLQVFFQSEIDGPSASDIFTVLGETWAFYTGDGPLSIKGFKKWIATPDGSKACFDTIRSWLPKSFLRTPETVANELVKALERIKPQAVEELDDATEKFIEFLFSRGFLPSYAFPRDLCALQIESGTKQQDGRRVVNIEQRPQQGLNIALSEYAPGRRVVVDKKTYRVGSVTASTASTVVNRAGKLFANRKQFLHCPACDFTAGFLEGSADGLQCPLCRSAALVASPVIQPEVAFPEGRKPVDEFDDEQTFSAATEAQLPLPKDSTGLKWSRFMKQGEIASAENQALIMVNKGEEGAEVGKDGFLVCDKCGKARFPSAPQVGSHYRDYEVVWPKGEKVPAVCDGNFHRVYLGYSFTSDILLFRVPLKAPLRFDARDRRSRQPMADALQSLCEAIVLGIGHTLDIDIREVNAGYRFVRLGEANHADIFVYDTLSGGAGYAVQAMECFTDVFKAAEAMLASCTCSTSCDRCLRHYGNRLIHSSLDRFLALDLVRFIKDGVTPPLQDRAAQQIVLKPLAELLRLAGWDVALNKSAPQTAVKGDRTLEIGACPSLIDPSSIGVVKGRLLFSPYEIARDLPGVFAQVG